MIVVNTILKKYLIIYKNETNINQIFVNLYMLGFANEST